MMDKRKKGWLQAALVLVVAVAAVAISEWVASLAEPPSVREQPTERVVRVDAQRVAPTAHRVRFTVTGAVQPRSYVDIVPEVSGRIVSVADSAFPGRHFEAGTVLFRIDPRDYRAAVARRRATVSQARRTLQQRQAQVRTAKREWERLHPGTEPPPLVARRPQLEEARASLEAAKSALAEADRDLEQTRFRFPFDGRVVESRVEKGQFVSAGRSYGRAYEDAVLEVTAPVTARQRDWLTSAPGAEATLRLRQDTTPQEYEGSFARMAAEADPTTRLLTAFFTFVDTPASAAPGEFVEVDLVGPEIEGVWVLPVRALQEDDTLWAVDESNRLRLVTPEIIHVTDEQVIAKSDGEAIRAVTEALTDATEGMKVEVRDAR